MPGYCGLLIYNMFRKLLRNMPFWKDKNAVPKTATSKGTVNLAFSCSSSEAEDSGNGGTGSGALGRKCMYFREEICSRYYAIPKLS